MFHMSVVYIYLTTYTHSLQQNFQEPNPQSHNLIDF